MPRGKLHDLCKHLAVPEGEVWSIRGSVPGAAGEAGATTRSSRRSEARQAARGFRGDHPEKMQMREGECHHIHEAKAPHTSHTSVQGCLSWSAVDKMRDRSVLRQHETGSKLQEHLRGTEAAVGEESARAAPGETIINNDQEQ